jgi:hypothetical protein
MLCRFSRIGQSFGGINLPRTLDYSATWAETTASLNAHKEALGAIAGLLLFIPNWVQGMLIGKLNVDGLAPGTNPWGIIAEHVGAYWYLYIPMILMSLVGSASIYALLTRKDLPRVGDAVMAGLAVTPIYFLSQLVVGFGTGMALIALIIPGLYVIGRLTPAAPALVAMPSRGVLGSITYAWELTRNNGWAVFGLLVVVAIVAGISMLVIQLISNLVITLVAGPEGIPLLQTGIAAVTETVVTVLMSGLGVAIYHQLAGQEG